MHVHLLSMSLSKIKINLLLTFPGLPKTTFGVPSLLSNPIGDIYSIPNIVT
jgi:hypothetical protein